MNNPKLPEPWLRGTLTHVDPAQRAVLHALELAKEDLEKWCGDVTDEELNARPGGVAPVAFHLRHIARSTDRLLTYAENRSLSPQQIAAMKQERMSEPRVVGRQQMPTTVAGLVIHVGDHAQRHVGQAITTAKIVKSRRQSL
jgi:DinB superfamily